MKKNWQNVLIVVLTFVLSFLVCFLGYIIYERNNGTLASWGGSTENGDTSNQEETLDIHSRFVTSLYNKVEAKRSFCRGADWLYEGKEFDVNTATDAEKVKLILNNFMKLDAEKVSCLSEKAKKVPREYKRDSNFTPIYSCGDIGLTGNSITNLTYYNGATVRALYKDLFGEDVTYTIPSIFAGMFLDYWIYNEELDIYVLYEICA